MSLLIPSSTWTRAGLPEITKVAVLKLSHASNTFIIRSSTRSPAIGKGAQTTTQLKSLEGWVRFSSPTQPSMSKQMRDNLAGEVWVPSAIWNRYMTTLEEIINHALKCTSQVPTRTKISTISIYAQMLHQIPSCCQSLRERQESWMVPSTEISSAEEIKAGPSFTNHRLSRPKKRECCRCQIFTSRCLVRQPPPSNAREWPQDSQIR